MPKRAMEILTESMFYVLMALTNGPLCGIEIASWIEARTDDRLKLGPATLYTVLGKFQKEGYICETDVDGRKRTYAITTRGYEAYLEEYRRLLLCVHDANQTRDEKGWIE